MADKGFTSGERRGLIVLLAIMSIIVAWSLVNKSCSESESRQVELSEEMKATHDSVIAAADTVRMEQKSRRISKTRVAKTKNKLPEGKKRNYLAEPVDEN